MYTVHVLKYLMFNVALTISVIWDQVIWRLGAQSITVQTFPGPTSELENTVLILLSDGCNQVEFRTLPLHQIQEFLELWILPSLVAMNSLILIVIERHVQYKLLKINKAWQLDVLVIFSLSCFNIHCKQVIAQNNGKKLIHPASIFVGMLTGR